MGDGIIYIMAEANNKDTNGIVDVLPGKDADVVGKHFANLHKAVFGKAYEELIGDVDVGYSKEELSDGKTRVRVTIKKK
jgi:hypothetical protein